MKQELLDRALDLFRKVGYVFLVTSDSNGLAHLSVASKLELKPEKELRVSSWFCPTTVTNLQINPNIGVIVWDKDSDSGYQILGRTKELMNLAMLDGYVPNIEERIKFPQVEWGVEIEPEKILLFKKSPHTDIKEE